jgi:hypothetical protein
MNFTAYRTAYRTTQTSAALFHIQHLDLAPEGWRPCVEKIAEGFSEIVGEHTYCLNCGDVIEGMQGHRVDCVTMVARRILANEPLLHARLRGAAPDVYVRLDAAFSETGVGPVRTAGRINFTAPVACTGTDG